MIYPKFLVGVQFGVAAILVCFSKGFFSSIFYILIFLLGASVGLWAISHNKRDNFNVVPELKEGAKLITTGAYRYIRHPMYFSVIVMALPFVLSTNSLIFWLLFLILILTLYLKATREESQWSKCSSSYCDYKRKTKAIIPFIL
jgi:protein-S-isoprenylcysteine O-methyltransferase Ste14